LAITEIKDLIEHGALSDSPRVAAGAKAVVTHATPDQAARMHRANIWADINLTSNIVTGALSAGGHPGQAGPVHGGPRQSVRERDAPPGQGAR
jgi:hypothetical protein